MTSSLSPSEARVRYHLVATAGHVDHGKSTLVRALTGTDPDRLAEEKERGMSIDLGFAHFLLPSGKGLSIVDVPGHARFLKNMVAGAGSVEGCLFVVSAKEGWREQSEEHLEVLELLGIKEAVVAVSQVDLATPDQLAACITEVTERLAKSALAGAAVVAVDALSAGGQAELIGALEEMTNRLAAPDDAGRPRLFIDRAFAMKGAGRVVTGTLLGGSLRLGELMAVLPGPAPGFRPVDVRLRRLQVHGVEREAVLPGERVAANLVGADVAELERGQALVKPTQWESTQMFDGALSVLPSAPAAVVARGNHQLHIGTSHQQVSVRLLGSSRIEPGGEGLARIHLRSPLPLVRGDRFLLRDGGRGTTIGGGEVLDVSPRLSAKRARPDRSIERVVREHGIIDVGLLERLTGVQRSPDVGGWVVDPVFRSETEARLRRLLREAGRLGLDGSALDEPERAFLSAMAEVTSEAGRYRLGADEDGREHPYLARAASEPFTPASESEYPKAELRDLARRGLLIDCDGLFLVPAALEQARSALSELLGAEPAGVTVSSFRQHLGTSRKVAMAILAHFDENGVTRRHGDLRRPGPALSRVDASPKGGE